MLKLGIYKWQGERDGIPTEEAAAVSSKKRLTTVTGISWRKLAGLELTTEPKVTTLALRHPGKIVWRPAGGGSNRWTVDLNTPDFAPKVCPNCGRNVKRIIHTPEGDRCLKCRPRGKPGRQPLDWGETHHLSIKITEAMEDYAVKLGRGNRQEGIRLALDYAMRNLPAMPTQKRQSARNRQPARVEEREEVLV